jgi:hypothetical protein
MRLRRAVLRLVARAVGRRRLRWLVGAAVLLALGGASAVAEPRPAGRSGAVADGYVVGEVNLSKGDRYDTIARVSDRLVLSGQTVASNGAAACHEAIVNPATLVLSQVHSGNCDDPALTGERVLPIETVERNSLPPGGGVFTETVRIAYVTSSSPGYRLGPVVMTFPQESTGRPGWVYGDGCLWLCDGETRQASDLLRISTANGAVLQRLAIPRVDRPLLAVDDDGLWIAPAVNSGGHSVYHVAPGASTAATLFSLPGPQYAAWMVAAGHDVWLEVGSGSASETLWRLVGASAKRTLHITMPTSALDGEVETQGGGSTVVGNTTDGLWTAVPPPSGNTQRIVRINPASGALTTVAVITPGYAVPNAIAYGGPVSAVTFDHAMYLLDPPTHSGNYPYAPTGFSALYRIAPPN